MTYGATVYTKSKGDYKIHYSKSKNAIPYTSKTYKTEQEFTQAIEKLVASNKWNVSNIVNETLGAWVEVSKKGE